MIDVDAIARAMFPAHVAGEADVAPTARMRSTWIRRAPCNARLTLVLR